MHAAVAGDELPASSDNDRRVLLTFPKQPHFFEQIRSCPESEVSYKRTDLTVFNTNTSSTSSARLRLSKWKRFWRDTKDELKTVLWRKWTSRFVALVLPAVFIFVILLLTVFICLPAVLFHSNDVCRPDGSFYYGLGTYKPWHKTIFFQIDVGFGHFSFADAKLIDFWWDLLVGRGGQLVMGFIGYKVFTKSLIRHMEVYVVPTETFEAITIQDQSINGLLKLLKGLTANRGSRSMILMIWYVVGAAYVVVFPSFISAMSGYAANVEAYIEVDSGPLGKYLSYL